MSGLSSSGLSSTGRLLVTTFGLGNLRPAPGTWGSLPPVVVAGVLAIVNAPAWAYNAILLCLILVFALACVVFGDQAEAHFNAKDPSSVCADETAGVCLPLLLLPASAFTSPLRVVGVMFGVFLLFRVLDILKPWPARGLQKLPAGWGVLLDDLASGLQAMIVIQVLVRVLW